MSIILVSNWSVVTARRTLVSVLGTLVHTVEGDFSSSRNQVDLDRHLQSPMVHSGLRFGYSFCIN